MQINQEGKKKEKMINNISSGLDTYPARVRIVHLSGVRYQTKQANGFVALNLPNAMTL